MNIKFGMNNFLVKYLKRFLNHEMLQSSAILGDFNKNDLKTLIKYLNLPNVKNMFEVQTEISEKFPELPKLFSMNLKDNEIIWTARELSQKSSKFIMDNINDIREYCKQVGWELDDVDEWLDINKDINKDEVIDNLDRDMIYDIVYGITHPDEETLKRCDLNLDGIVNEKDIELFDEYYNNAYIGFTIKKSNRNNYFPNKDMLVFINQFTGSFIYNYAIKDEEGGAGIDYIPHYDPTQMHKIAIYECKPGQKVTIAHNCPKSVKLLIASSPAILKQDIANMMVQKPEEVILRPGEGFQYQTSSVADNSGYDAHWLCIQCPSNYGTLSTKSTKTAMLEVGDINFDGRIDMQDYHLLARYTAEGPGSEELHWNATPKQLRVMDTDSNGKVTIKDAEYLLRYINHDPQIPSLGIVSYTYEVDGEYDEGDNVDNLLIIDGHYDKSVNIPFMEFVTDDWVIHDKFFNYLLGMAIHKYSNADDITYLQKLLKVSYTEHFYDPSFFYPGNYSSNMKKLVEEYQKSKVNFSIGDLNRDGKINKDDLTLLRQYLDDLDDIKLVTDYINGNVNKLTSEQLKRLDVNKDRVVDERDKVILENQLKINYSAEFKRRADVNKDGYWNELDYEKLKREVDGISDDLKNYNISFILGWYDVQTEELYESQYNDNGNISEVSK